LLPLWFCTLQVDVAQHFLAVSALGHAPWMAMQAMNQPDSGYNCRHCILLDTS
jgi:hypothetical protein